MDVQGTVTTPGQQKPKTNILRIVLIVAGVLACLCVVVAAVIFYIGSTQVDQVQLSIACSLMNTGAAAEDCTAWAEQVKTDYPDDYDECMDQKPTDGSVYGAVYQCLQDKGLGLGDLN